MTGTANRAAIVDHTSPVVWDDTVLLQPIPEQQSRLLTVVKPFEPMVRKPFVTNRNRILC